MAEAGAAAAEITAPLNAEENLVGSQNHETLDAEELRLTAEQLPFPAASEGPSNDQRETLLSLPKKADWIQLSASHGKILLRFSNEERDSDDSDGDSGGNNAEGSNFNEVKHGDIGVEDKTSKEDTGSELRSNDEYNLEPLYVMELHDKADDERILRKEYTEPFNDTMYQYSTAEYVKEQDKTKHIFEYVLMKDTRWISKEVYEYEQARQDALRTLPVSRRGIRITSPLLREAFNRVVRHYYDTNLYGEYFIPVPYRSVFHYREQLLDYANAKSDSVKDGTKIQIEALFAFVDRQYGTEVEDEKRRHQQDPPLATFKNYWMLFNHGTLVYYMKDDMLSIWVVNQVLGGPTIGFETEYEIGLCNVGYDGHRFGRHYVGVSIPPWTGERPVRSFPVWPVALAPGSSEERSSRYLAMIERGKKYVKMMKPTYWLHRGLSVHRPRRTYNSGVMVDTALHPWHDNPKESSLPSPAAEWDPGSGCECLQCTIARELQRVKLNVEKNDVDFTLIDEMYAICSASVQAFVLTARKWEILAVDQLEEYPENKELINQLVIDAEDKQMIKAICQTYATDSHHNRRTAWSADIIQGKGEGQIFLLHGKPGVGKTLTAECVAGYTRRPLLALSPADIGIEAKDVEKNLISFFEMGERWGAIVLLDEADVYLESRDMHDLARNSLVAVFLRLLEYYQGILFITTNRVGSFDEAFTSRIHVSLHYAELTNQYRETIWDNMINKLEEDRPEVYIDEKVYDYVKTNETLTGLEWNGRQIRNAFQTAVSLAEYSSAEAALADCKYCKKTGHPPELCDIKFPRRDGNILLSRDHIEQVVKMSSRFTKYLDRTHNADASERAKLAKIRNDTVKKEK